MNRLRNLAIILSVLGCISFSTSAFSQGRNSTGNNHRATSGTTATVRPSAGSLSQRPTVQATRPTTSPSSRPTTTNTVRPGNTVNNNNHGINNGNHGNNTITRPTTTTTVRPGNTGNNNGSHGNNWNNGHGSANRPNYPTHNWGNSAPSPGRPIYGNNYRPSHPNGGYWAAPPVNVYRPTFILPPAPRRYTTVRVGVPTIGNILGLAFGSLIDTGINTLLNGGYNVIGYANNMVYLSNVNQLGYMWPEATVYYNNGLMTNTQFQYWTAAASMSRFNMVYNQLCSLYGMPVEDAYVNGMRTVSWWGGNNTGYVTLQYGYGNSTSGYGNYYTTLTYGM